MHGISIFASVICTKCYLVTHAVTQSILFNVMISPCSAVVSDVGARRIYCVVNVEIAASSSARRKTLLSLSSFRTAAFTAENMADLFSAVSYPALSLRTISTACGVARATLTSAVAGAFPLYSGAVPMR